MSSAVSGQGQGGGELVQGGGDDDLGGWVRPGADPGWAADLGLALPGRLLGRVEARVAARSVVTGLAEPVLSVRVVRVEPVLVVCVGVRVVVRVPESIAGPWLCAPLGTLGAIALIGVVGPVAAIGPIVVGLGGRRAVAAAAAGAAAAGGAGRAAVAVAAAAVAAPLWWWWW